MQWMHRYERFGRYNSCGTDALRNHIEMSLSGATLKVIHLKRRSACSQPTYEWKDLAGLLFIPLVKTQILMQFRQVNQLDYNEDKLRARK